MQPPEQLVSVERVESAILWLRGQRVILDTELAALYEVELRSLIQAVSRNRARFPSDFAFQLSESELESLRSQTVILKKGRGRHRKYLPYAFTEQGVAMLSSVLRSPRAVKVNVEIMRAFVRLRRLLQSNTELAAKLAELEKKYDAAVQGRVRRDPRADDAARDTRPADRFHPLNGVTLRVGRRTRGEGRRPLDPGRVVGRQWVVAGASAGVAAPTRARSASTPTESTTASPTD